MTPAQLIAQMPHLGAAHRVRVAGLAEDLGGLPTQIGAGIDTVSSSVAQGAESIASGVQVAAQQAGAGIDKAGQGVKDTGDSLADTADTTAKIALAAAIGIPLLIGAGLVAAIIVVAKSAGKVGAAAVGPGGLYPAVASGLIQQAPQLLPLLMGPEGAAVSAIASQRPMPFPALPPWEVPAAPYAPARATLVSALSPFDQPSNPRNVGTYAQLTPAQSQAIGAQVAALSPAAPAAGARSASGTLVSWGQQPKR